MKTTDDLMFETISRGLQAPFEALNEVARDMSVPRQKALYAKTDRVQRARHQLDALLDERRAELASTA